MAASGIMVEAVPGPPINLVIPPHRFLSAIPILFGVQQLIEGVIWLTFRFDSPVLNPAMILLYSLFSHVLWPIYVPFAVLLLEPVPWRSLSEKITSPSVVRPRCVTRQIGLSVPRSLRNLSFQFRKSPCSSTF